MQANVISQAELGAIHAALEEGRALLQRADKLRRAALRRVDRAGYTLAPGRFYVDPETNQVEDRLRYRRPRAGVRLGVLDRA